jgi:ACDE family multidrug resistance protein
VVIPISGVLSDRFGRKKVIIPSLLLYGAGGVLAGFASTAGSYTTMLAGRILQGIGAAGTAPIAMALVSDLYRGEKRSKALGILEASNGMGKVLSPIFGALLALIVWYAVYFAFPVLILPATAALWFFVKEPARTGQVPPIAQYGRHLKKTWKRQGKWLLVAFLAGAVTLFILFGVLFHLSDILETKYRIDGILKGLILAIPLLAMSSTSYWTGGHIRQKMRRMRFFISGGLFAIALAMAVIPFFTNTYVLLGLLVLIGIGSGLVLPSLNTLITSAVGSEERGIVTSLYGSVRFLGVAIGPPVFGALESQRFLLFLGAGALAALSGALALKTIRQTGLLRGKGGQTRLLLRKKGLQPT